MKKENVEKVKKEKTKVPKEKKIKSVNSDTKVILGIVGGMILLCAALIFYYFFGVNGQVLATYEGGKVTRGEYTLYYKLFEPMLSYYGYDSEMIKQEVLNKVVIDKIVLEKANDAKVEITDEKKTDIEKIFADEDEVATYVEQGIDPKKMKQVYYDDAVISAYIEKLTSEATEETIKAFIDETEGKDANYNKYVTSYILFTYEGEDGDTAKVKANAEAALNRIKKGEDFAKVGEEIYEKDSVYTQYGEDFELFLNGSTVPAYENAVRNMKAGTMTQELVESEEYGYFIIKLESVAQNDRITGEDAADNYVNELLAKWQDDAKIKAKDKKIDNVAASLSSAS